MTASLRTSGCNPTCNPTCHGLLPYVCYGTPGTESPFEWLFDETHVNVRGVPWALQLFQFCFVNGHLLGHDCLSAPQRKATSALARSRPHWTGRPLAAANRRRLLAARLPGAALCRLVRSAEPSLCCPL